MSQVEIKSPDEIAIMREAGRIVCEILVELGAAGRAGATTWDLERLSEDLAAKKHARPAFKGYLGFPCCLCSSINDEVIHGIPSKKRKLKEGDLLKLDFGVFFRGYVGDAAITVPIGRVSPEAQAILDATRQALHVGIEQGRVGKRVGDIGHSVQRFVEARGYSVVRDFVGHGVGKQLHEQPQVPNFGLPSTGMRLMPGMTIAVEPMVNAGTYKVEVLDDDWTAVTLDRRLSAHFEHTILITRDGPEILTRPPDQAPLW